MDLQELNGLVAQLRVLRANKEAAEDKVSEASAEVIACQTKIIEGMTNAGLDSYKCADGNVSLSSRFSAKLPQGEAKELFFSELKKTGEFDTLATIHSATFNSWLSEKIEEAKAKGDGFPKIPGISPEDIRAEPTLRFTKPKPKAE